MLRADTLPTETQQVNCILIFFFKELSGRIPAWCAESPGLESGDQEKKKDFNLSIRGTAHSKKIQEKLLNAYPEPWYAVHGNNQPAVWLSDLNNSW